MKSAQISSGNTKPTDSFAPNAWAMRTTVSVAVPESPAFDRPMQRAPISASQRMLELVD